jgi:transcriptional regulator with PAS, ATPase and Fis domain
MIKTFARAPVASALCSAAATGLNEAMSRVSRRVADRRRGTASLIAALTSALPMTREPRALRQRFEEELRDRVRARSIGLRDSTSSATAPAGALTIDVIAGAFTLGAIDVVFEEATTIDEWDLQMLEAARQIAVLVLLLERAQRAGFCAVARSRPDGAAPIIGSSAGMRAVRERMERVALTDFTVLIEGESGSGKELVARHIHELSARRNGPFVPVNCAAIVETLLEAELFGIEERTATGVRGRRGKFEHAHEGTLFLDEIADLSPAAQAKLLRAIQEMSVERVGTTGARRVDVRIIAATNQKLTDLVARGAFRLDLFYRVHGVEIIVPPLRERPDDILELTEYFLERHSGVRRLRLSLPASEALTAHRWPGNVRELERVIERAVALADCDELRLDDLPASIGDLYRENLMPSFTCGHTMRVWGSRYARLVLDRCGYNKRKACRELGISYHTLRDYLKELPEYEYGFSSDIDRIRARRTALAAACAPGVEAPPQEPEIIP